MALLGTTELDFKPIDPMYLLDEKFGKIKRRKKSRADWLTQSLAESRASLGTFEVIKVPGGRPFGLVKLVEDEGNRRLAPKFIDPSRPRNIPNSCAGTYARICILRPSYVVPVYGFPPANEESIACKIHAEWITWRGSDILPDTHRVCDYCKWFGCDNNDGLRRCQRVEEAVPEKRERVTIFPSIIRRCTVVPELWPLYEYLHKYRNIPTPQTPPGQPAILRYDGLFWKFLVL
jgi:hypothetical protein